LLYNRKYSKDFSIDVIVERLLSRLIDFHISVGDDIGAIRYSWL
jgi:hypothetical protein